MVCVLVLVPGCSRGEGAERRETPDEILATMRKELGTTFHYRKVRCFVAAGDVSAARFEQLCTHTLAACHDAYVKQFFRKPPVGTYRVYLFRDAASYEGHVKRLFGRTPGTPFGYYSHSRRALVMNIGTGGGTLVHEMFHALVSEDFPDIPAWANEGIASLFEQCRITGSGLVGLVNWRLPILQKHIRDGTVLPLRKIMTMTDAEFYRDRQGKYAAARYFMMYLQSQGKLEPFYRRFRDGYKDDKTGVRYAEEAIGNTLEEFEPRWRVWVLKLRR